MSDSTAFKKVAWSDQLEEYFAEIAEKSQGYAWLHKKAEGVFAYRRSCIDLPVIVLSTVAGTLSIGNASLFGKENEQIAGTAIGCLSLIVGVMNTISTYFAFSKRAEGHRLCYIEYSKLYRFITIELSLPRGERMTCGDLLKVVKEQYERLQEISPLIPDKLLSDFKRRFREYENVAKPSECNGLQSVQVFRSGRKQTLFNIIEESKRREEAYQYSTTDDDEKEGYSTLSATPVTKKEEDLV